MPKPNETANSTSEECCVRNRPDHKPQSCLRSASAGSVDSTDRQGVKPCIFCMVAVHHGKMLRALFLVVFYALCMIHVLFASCIMRVCFVLCMWLRASLSHWFANHGPIIDQSLPITRVLQPLRDALFCVGCLRGVLFCGVFCVFSWSGVPCGFLRVSAVGCGMIFHGDNAEFAPYHPLLVVPFKQHGQKSPGSSNMVKSPGGKVTHTRTGTRIIGVQKWTMYTDWGTLRCERPFLR